MKKGIANDATGKKYLLIMKTQQEVNNFFQENTVHVSAIYQIVQYLKDLNLKLPNNVILHEKGIDQAYFFEWFDNSPFKPGDVLVTKGGNLALFSHLEEDVVYYHCILKPFGCFFIQPGCGIGKTKDCYISSEDQKQRLLDNLKNYGYEFDAQTNSLKKIKYPKTYKECCDVLLISPYYNLRYHTYERGYNEYATSNNLLSLQDKLNTLGKLLICRDAYWKIAGEQMGLGKPWKSPLPSLFETVYCIRRKNNKIIKGSYRGGKSEILEFPTEEMRDTFYENFKDLIEKCKELL